MEQQLTLISVSYNSRDVMTRCLGPVIDSKAYPTIIIDNASRDGSPNAYRDCFPGAIVKALSQNIGYGRAANVGLELVETPYALLLNPDLTASLDGVEALLAHALQDLETAIWGPATLKSDFTGEPPASMEWISGSAMLFDMEKLRTIGFFDENIFLFFEETDLCRRARNKGFKVKLCRDVHFNHLLGQACASNPAVDALKAWHYGWSRCYYFDKHGLAYGKRAPRRQYRQYLLKSWLAMKGEKRHKYRFQSMGAAAFIRGEEAFRDDGSPRAGGRRVAGQDMR